MPAWAWILVGLPVAPFVIYYASKWAEAGRLSARRYFGKSSKGE
jgi:hypothetical protein